MITSNKKRFSSYGINSYFLPSGSRNAISDVEGVTVGHVTKIERDNIRTGVTIIDPGIQDVFNNKLPAAIAVGNGYGKLAGITQVEELGSLETPIALTNTLAVGKVVRGVVNIVLDTCKIAPIQSINAVVGETNDGFLNELHADSISPEDVMIAYKGRTPDFAIGNVGAGTGTRSFAWKGGIGTSSRQVKIDNQQFTVGVLTQTNYGGSLVLGGVPIGQLWDKHDFKPFLERTKPDGSCMIVIATDAPVTSRQLKRMANRSFVALGRTGSVLANGSGDYAIAFSTNKAGFDGVSKAVCISDEQINSLFLAVVEAVEESVYDALFAAETMIGTKSHTLEAFPVEQFLSVVKK